MEQFNKLAKDFSTIYDKIDVNGIIVLKNKKYDVYVLLLIPPDHRTDFVNEQSKYCYLSTKLLLMDDLIPTPSRDNVLHTNPQLFSFKGNNKIGFANGIDEVTADFSGFQKTIDMIVNIKDL